MKIILSFILRLNHKFFWGISLFLWRIFKVFFGVKRNEKKVAIPATVQQENPKIKNSFHLWQSVQIYLSKYIYLSIYLSGEKLKNKVIQTEEFDMKDSRHYNVSVLINYHQDWWMFNEIQNKGGDYIYRERGR